LTCIENLSYGGLIVPSDEFKNNIFRIERLFNKITKDKIPEGQGVVKNLTKKIFNRMEMPEKYYHVVQKYVKQRILIRMKYLNHHSNLFNKKEKLKQICNDFKNLEDL